MFSTACGLHDPALFNASIFSFHSFACFFPHPPKESRTNYGQLLLPAAEDAVEGATGDNRRGGDEAGGGAAGAKAAGGHARGLLGAPRDRGA